MVKRMFEEIPKGVSKPHKRVGKCRNCGESMEGINGNRIYCDKCLNKNKN